MIIFLRAFSHFFPLLISIGKTIVPKAVTEIKLISSGKILENNKTVGQCKIPFGEVPGGVIIMHVVVQPSLAKTKTGIYIFILTNYSICMTVPFVPEWPEV